MAKPGDIRAGGAFIELSADDTGLRRALDQTQAKVSVFSASITRSLAGIAGAAGFGMLAKSSLNAASNFEIAQRRFSAAFRQFSAAAQAWVRQTSNAFGYGEGSLMDFMATFQQSLTPMGFAEREAAQMSQTFTRLGMDLAARFGRPAEEAMSALQMTMMGSTRALRRFGVGIDEVAVRQELMARGMAGATDRLTEQQRAYGVMAAVLRRTAQYQGAAATEANTWAQTTMRLREMWTDVLEVIGKPLGEALTPVLNMMTGALRQIRGFLERNPAFIQGIVRMAGIAAGAVLTVSKGLSAIGVALGSMLVAGSRNAESAITYVGNRIKSGFGDALAELYNRWSAATDAMRDMAVNLAMAGYHSAMAYVHDFAEGFKGAIQGAYTDAFDGMLTKAEGAFQTLQSWWAKYMAPIPVTWHGAVPANYLPDSMRRGSTEPEGEMHGPPIPSAADQHRADAAARMAAFRAGMSRAMAGIFGGGGGTPPPEGYRMPRMNIPGASAFEAPTLPAGGVMGFMGARRIGEMMGGGARGIDGQQLDVQRQMLYVLESIRDSDQGAVYA